MESAVSGMTRSGSVRWSWVRVLIPSSRAQGESEPATCRSSSCRKSRETLHSLKEELLVKTGFIACEGSRGPLYNRSYTHLKNYRGVEVSVFSSIVRENQDSEGETLHSKEAAGHGMA